jgi:pimeloyl-ACP methyl ester carboxylesterase
MKIALLHALPLDERMWEPQLPALAAHEVCTPNLYRLGPSMDEWALGVLQQVPGRLVAVGSSMGGYCASAIARLAPERLDGLVLVGSRADADPPDREPLRNEWIRIAREEGGEGLWRTARDRLLGPDADPAVVERAHRIAAQQDGEELARAVGAIRDRVDSVEAVTSGIPLLVVAGEDDVMIPPGHARELAAASPNGRAEILEGCGHLPSMERPEELNRILAAFLGEL